MKTRYKPYETEDECANCAEEVSHCAARLDVDHKPCCKKCDHYPRKTGRHT